jgi:hypothetical protein
MRFWAKNLGIINAVALHELDQSNATLRAMLAICVKPDLAKPLLGSLLGKIGNLSEGPFVLPFVPAGVAGLKNFVAIPKDLVSKRVPTPTGWNDLGKEAKKSHPMKYAYWAGALRLCTVSEPFLTPVIQHVFNTIGGAGVPDYPEHMKEILKKILEDFNAAPVAAAATPSAGVQPVPVAEDRLIPVIAPPAPQPATTVVEIQEPPVPAVAEKPAPASAQDPSPAISAPTPNPTEEAL